MIVVAGAVQGDGAVLTAAYRGASPVSDDQLSFPWEGATAITTSVVWGTTQVLLLLGLIAFARTSVPNVRIGRAGAALAVAGAALYVLAHLRGVTPLALGAWMVLMVPLQFTAALPLAVGGYAVAVMAFGVALIAAA